MRDDEAKAEICRRMTEGESVRAICASEGMPGRSTVHRWLVSDEAFARDYAAARLILADVLFDEIMEIADTPKLGIKRTNKPTGEEFTEADMIEHRRLQVDARKWVASKMNPRKYGEATLLKHADANGERFREMESTEIAARLAAIAASVAGKGEK
jgi:hypothetical protein